MVSQASDYGVDARPFVGGKAAYKLEDLASYRESTSIAVAPYRALFNSNPELSDPQLVILDDAHSAEASIAEFWSVLVPRDAPEDLYLRLLAQLEDKLPASSRQVFVSGDPGRFGAQVELVPFGAFLEKQEAIREVMDAAAAKTPGSEWAFSWGQLRSNLLACGLFIDLHQILIRPYILPTLTHRPFAGANQRIYLSASLGTGGDLERAMGVRSIHRVKTPKTYERRSIGRRFFVFPDARHGPAAYSQWLVDRFRDPQTPRSLVLAPSNSRTWGFKRFIEPVLARERPPIPILGAKDIEDALDPFTSAERAVLLLANRYDGIDLPQDACRQAVLLGLPSGTNLQERFLEARIGLESFFAERIRTRILQGAGRCTREDTDFALVIMVDRRLYDFCARAENRASLHPELRAEIAFGLAQAEASLDEYDRLVDWFLSKSTEWQKAEANIAAFRDEAPARPDVETIESLSVAASSEVSSLYSAWNGDYDAAIASGRAVVDALSGVSLSRYRALWSYFVACYAYASTKAGADRRAITEDFIARASAAAETVSWLSRALRSIAIGDGPLPAPDDVEGLAVEGVCSCLAKLGAVGPRFEERMTEIATMIDSSEANKFDRGVVALGELLGFESWKPEGSGAPDGVWMIPSQFAIVFEGKSDVSAEGEITIEHCRQARGHLDWAAAAPELKHTQTRTVVLESPTRFVSASAQVHAGDIRLVGLDEMRRLFSVTRRCLADSRHRLSSSQPDQVRDIVLANLRRDHLSPRDVLARLTRQKVIELTPVRD